MSAQPYGSAARAYLTAGYWPLPLPPRKKASPPGGYTGRSGREVSAEDVDRWLAENRSGNIGLRLPRGSQASTWTPTRMSAMWRPGRN